MAANNADESPLGFAGDIDGGTSSFRLSTGQQQPPHALGSNTGPAASSALPVQMGRLPPPSAQDPGLVGGGVLLEGAEAGRSVVTWRVRESGLWLEERGLDDDLEGGGLHLQLQGWGYSTSRASPWLCRPLTSRLIKAGTAHAGGACVCGARCIHPLPLSMVDQGLAPGSISGSRF